MAYYRQKLLSQVHKKRIKIKIKKRLLLQKLLLRSRLLSNNP